MFDLKDMQENVQHAEVDAGDSDEESEGSDDGDVLTRIIRGQL